ncbi:hypothetical protein NDU88_002407 [Pleurodeles waltl]|uniref:Uncharacterized protein n=1 Tax=Pleurodeles waltl TaxID=8319 RepID=A0AAV7KUP2_PLEWA|nr:hypothetical protein NDU88_002407 [Pleurodeles waltl]
MRRTAGTIWGGVWAPGQCPKVNLGGGRLRCQRGVRLELERRLPRLVILRVRWQRRQVESRTPGPRPVIRAAGWEEKQCGEERGRCLLAPGPGTLPAPFGFCRVGGEEQRRSPGPWRCERRPGAQENYQVAAESLVPPGIDSGNGGALLVVRAGAAEEDWPE